ncbi:hypothetical protein ID866_8053 [Astraeus odoratus]|nr:hypothetical protein ID866_8053 [Astraeus odoratus]
MSTTFAGFPAFTYQAPYPAFVAAPGQPAAVAYPAQFAAAGYPVLYGLPPPNPATTPNYHPVSPDIHAISPEIVSKQMQKLIVAQLKQTPFDAIEPAALLRLEMEVVACKMPTFLPLILSEAHSRPSPLPAAKDVLLACDEQGLKIKDLHTVASKSKSIDLSVATSFDSLPPRPCSPALLPSDDEGTPSAVPMTLRQIPSNFPPLPPKHTYLNTPASPPKKAALPSLERKLKNASLVQESLKNLLTATEDNLGQEDAELLGHIVNWEASTYPRKRWKVSSA